MKPILSGGSDDSAQILDGGVQTVQSGGVASNTTIDSGGTEIVQSGGVASNTVISGGTLDIQYGGTLSGTLTFSQRRHLADRRRHDADGDDLRLRQPEPDDRPHRALVFGERQRGADRQQRAQCQRGQADCQPAARPGAKLRRARLHARERRAWRYGDRRSANDLVRELRIGVLNDVIKSIDAGGSGPELYDLRPRRSRPEHQRSARGDQPAKTASRSLFKARTAVRHWQRTKARLLRLQRHGHLPEFARSTT